MMRHARTALAAAIFALPLALPLAAQKATLPLWPHHPPEPPSTTEPEKDVTTPQMPLISGHRSARLTPVMQPMLYVYEPSKALATHPAVLVFPGGGYSRLAWDGEGLDSCKWLNSVGVTCVLVKYRVPEERYPTSYADLEDAQQAMRLTRAHAEEWNLNPKLIGILGFSAGAHLAVALSSHADDTHVMSTPAADDVNSAISAKADFAMVIYPAYTAADSDAGKLTVLDPNLAPTKLTPTTFLLQAENDPVHVENAVVYFLALKKAHIPAEMHLYPTGGHGFGLHPINSPESHWTDLATTWLRSIGVIPSGKGDETDGNFGGTPQTTPCAVHPTSIPARAGRPDTPNPPQQTNDPNCP
ncbi:Acetyl esterase/lipase [Bryocella elongata]|uniref:Acetyl esterase/lipase n=1 Tax=Bryocella elongata TaxID=863522 RepID=A0A1H6B1F5_9BACT|nr:alpha/beta hydrolase [Bryocella elongata]SEG54639.1 Acetyl esterase/lipase [Bryocella elongata]